MVVDKNLIKYIKNHFIFPKIYKPNKINKNKIYRNYLFKNRKITFHFFTKNNIPF